MRRVSLAVMATLAVPLAFPLTLASLPAAQAQAQPQGPAGGSPDTAVLQNQVTRDLFERATRPSGANATPRLQPAPAPAPTAMPTPAPNPTPNLGPAVTPAPVAGAAATGYRPTPAVTQRVREQFLAWVAQTAGPAGAAELRQVMQQNDVLALWAQQMGADGLRPNDVTDALTAYWVQNWQMAHAVETTTPAQVQGVRAQVAPILAANPAFAGMTDAQRQEMAEIYVYNQFVQGTAWMTAGQQGDRALQAKLGEAAVTRFRSEMGIDLMQLQLTDAGFAKRP